MVQLIYRMKNNIQELQLEELFQELGMSDYLFIETSNYLEELQQYREILLTEIKKKYGQSNINQNLDSSK